KGRSCADALHAREKDIARVKMADSRVVTDRTRFRRRNAPNCALRTCKLLPAPSRGQPTPGPHVAPPPRAHEPRTSPREGRSMFQSIIDLFPAEWRGPVMVLAAPLRWIPAWQTLLLTSMSGQHPATVALAAAAFLMPVLLLIAGMW